MAEPDERASRTPSGQRGAAPAPDDEKRPIRRALLSVYDKTGVVGLGRALADAGVAIVSTGSTAAELTRAGVGVTTVEALTGFPECLDGRVKTLHPNVHAGILADRRRPDHERQLAELGIAPFDLVVGNLYPFLETVASGAGEDAVVEQIDIGGPSMMRAAAKNHNSVAVVVDPAAYGDVVAALDSGGFDLATRRRLAAAAFAHTAAYDAAVANFFHAADGPPPYLGVALERAEMLRYGENPHQSAALYVQAGAPPGLAGAEQLHGKQMSYNNYVDTEAALRAAHDFATPCVAVVKHATPCGIALGADVAEAHRRAHATDPTSAFGGVVAANRPVSMAMAQQVAEVFTEVIAAPGYDDGALDVLAHKKNLRVLAVPDYSSGGLALRQICGGALAQVADQVAEPGDAPDAWTLAAGDAVDEATLADLTFAWRACRSAKSNAILLASRGAAVGIGMGQVNRVDAARLAVSRAGVAATGSVAASDAFFPFPDGLEVLAEAGVRAVVEPGGSLRDDQVIEAAGAAGVALYFTGVRHFLH